jgi:dihydrofolate reductase
MRKVLVLMFMTLDGVAEFPDYEDPDSDASGDGPPMWNSQMDTTDTLLLGRKTYEKWAAYWPGQQKNPSATPFQKRFSQFADRVEKVVFSKTLKSADWPKSRIVRGDLGEEIVRIRSLPGKDIVLGGGPRLAQSLLERDLADELFLIMFPSIVGKGKPLFRVVSTPDNNEDVVPRGAPGRHDFRLIEALPLGSTIQLHYSRASP